MQELETPLHGQDRPAHRQRLFAGLPLTKAVVTTIPLSELMALAWIDERAKGADQSGRIFPGLSDLDSARPIGVG